MSVSEALTYLGAREPAELPFATLDHLRTERTGFSEAIFCPGKSDDQIASIAVALSRRHGVVIATRGWESAYLAVREQLPEARFDREARVISYESAPLARIGRVVVVSAGTSDKAVAAEAAACLELMGNEVARIDDVGVAGLHRVLGHVGALRTANAIVAVAGMDGALPAVIAGLTDKPIIAVPTSVGYGASFGGLAALLTMLNACAGGVSVVNIDNGYGAACTATRINRVAVARLAATAGDE